MKFKMPEDKWMEEFNRRLKKKHPEHINHKVLPFFSNESNDVLVYCADCKELLYILPANK